MTVVDTYDLQDPRLGSGRDSTGVLTTQWAFVYEE
jgi:hypothetical protein